MPGDGLLASSAEWSSNLKVAAPATSDHIAIRYVLPVLWMTPFDTVGSTFVVRA